MSKHICECCGEVNGWIFIDPVYELVCGPCADEGDTELCEYSGIYRIVKQCSGCGKYGAANYDGGSSPEYYCGGSQYCIP